MACEQESAGGTPCLSGTRGRGAAASRRGNASGHLHRLAADTICIESRLLTVDREQEDGFLPNTNTIGELG